MLAHPLLPKLRLLRLSGMAHTLDLRASQAAEQGLSPVEFLALLLDDELDRRQQKRMSQRLAQSSCDPQKSLAHFDFAAAPGVNRTAMMELATCAFVVRHENVLLCGPTGVGKSHLAQAIAYEGLKRDLHVLMRNTQRLLLELHLSRANGGYQRLLARVLGVDLLVLDDFGLQPINAQGAQDLYDIINERYERGSILLTSNRAFAEWAEPFANDLLASAALDRLTHHAHIEIVRGQSYRQTHRLQEVPPANSV